MKKALLLILPIIALAALLFAYPIFSVTSSPTGIFNVTPDFVFLNWTNNYASNISIGVINSSFSNVNFTIVNSTGLVANYSQSNTLAACNAYNLLVNNATGLGSTTPKFNVSNITNVSLIDVGHLGCTPGRYWNSTFTITNNTGAETANVTVIVDIPISTANSLSSSTGIGTFNGTLPINATTYQSYYFNTSNITGATAVSINLTTNSSQIAQLFLFDNAGRMQAKSINTNTSQYLNYYGIPSTPAMWEIRVYGNSTSSLPYNGSIIYSFLNLTNATSSPANKTVFNLTYGNMNVSANAIGNLFLTNNGSVASPSLALSYNIFRIQNFSGGGSKNFTFLVEDSSIANKVRVSLHWTGTSNYTLNVYDSNGTLQTTTSNSYTLANVTNATSQELYNETASIIPGYWIASVISNSGGDNYNINATVFENPSNFIATNYSAQTLSPQNSVGIQVNLTAQNSTVDGAYGGALLFRDSNGGGINVPIYFNITTPTILVMNVTPTGTTLLTNPFSADTFRQDENYGAALTKTINFNISNIGSFDQVINMTVNSSATLTCSSCSFNANFTYNTISYVPAHTSQLFQVNVTFNSSFPANSYLGWIFINASNSTITSNSHPYSSYNLTIQLNLTNSLLVKNGLVLASNGSNVANGTVSENAMQAVNVYFVNGTEIKTLGLSNFTQVWLQEKNVTSSLGTVPANQSLPTAIATGSTLYCPGSCSNFVVGAYDLNLTIPANTPGGQYGVYTNLTFNNGTSTYYGQGVNASTLIVSNTGLFLSANFSGGYSGCGFGSTCPNSSATFSINPNATVFIFANVTNYGPRAASSAMVSFYNPCSGFTISSGPSFSCSAGTSNSGNYWNWSLTVPAYSSCAVNWTITAASASGGASACNANIFSDKNIWFDPFGVNMSVTVNNVNSSSSSSNSNNNNNNNLPSSSSTPAYLSITNYPTFVYIVQNSTNATSVSVNNINDTKSQDIDLTITNLTSSWFSVTPSIQTSIAHGKSANFNISFNAPGSAAVADYYASFSASSNYGNASQVFILRVLPSANTKVLINQTYQLYLLNYTELASAVNQTKAGGGNTTVLEADLTLVKGKLDQAQTFISSGDYFSAQQALNDAKALLDKAHTDYQNLTQSPLTNILGLLQGNILYIAIGGAAAVVGFVTYLFWPSKEGATSTVFKPKEVKTVQKNADEESVWKKLKNKWSWESLKNKWKNR